MDPSTATRWPFMFIVDGLGRNTGWIVIHAPIHSSTRKNLFSEYRRHGFDFIGMCSFMNFPRATEDDPLDYGAVCEGWCHCFRKPENFLPNDRPQVLLSLSDFIDPQMISREHLGPFSDIPAFDFVYVGADKPWKMKAKNWQLAQKCLPRLCTDLKLRGLVIGVPPRFLPPTPRLTVWPWLPHHFFLQVLSRSRFLFVPNKLDASPRILVEALCLNIPLLVYRPILGGWKYVSTSTGIFFDQESSVTEAAHGCLTGNFQPRSWYLKHHSPKRAGLALQSLLQQIDPGFTATGTLNMRYELTH